MDKKIPTYSGKFIDLKPDEVKALVELKRDSTFKALKKIAEMKKILDTIPDLYDKVISKDSLKYLELVSKVRRFQVEAFKGEVKEVKKALQALKKKTKGGRRGGGRGGGGGGLGKVKEDKGDKDFIPPGDPLGKLAKALANSRSTADLEKAISDYANYFCQAGVTNLLRKGTIGKVISDAFTVIKKNVSNAVFEGKIGWDSSGWNSTSEFYDILKTAFSCMTQLKPVLDFLKSLFRRAFRILRVPFRRGDRPPNPTGGRGDGPDDDQGDGPPRPPSEYERYRRFQMLQAIQGQQDSIAGGIGAASGGMQGGVSGTGGGNSAGGASGTGGSSAGGSSAGGGTTFGNLFGNLFGGMFGTGGGSGSSTGGTGAADEDERSGDPTNDSGSGAVALYVPPPTSPIIPEPFVPLGSGNPYENFFGGGIPSGHPEDIGWDPLNLFMQGLGASLLGYNMAQGGADPVGGDAIPLPPPGGDPVGGDPIPMPAPGGDPVGGDVEGDFVDAPDLPDDFEQEREEMQDAEDAQRDAEEDDAKADRNDIMRSLGESSVPTAGTLFGGGIGKGLRVITDPLLLAAMTSRTLTNQRRAARQSETIDERVELRDVNDMQARAEILSMANLINEPQTPTQPSPLVLTTGRASLTPSTPQRQERQTPSSIQRFRQRRDLVRYRQTHDATLRRLEELERIVEQRGAMPSPEPMAEMVERPSPPRQRPVAGQPLLDRIRRRQQEQEERTGKKTYLFNIVFEGARMVNAVFNRLEILSREVGFNYTEIIRDFEIERVQREKEGGAPLTDQRGTRITAEGMRYIERLIGPKLEE